MYDDTCRFLAENFSADFASWLLGEAVTLSEIEPSELSLDPIRADALIFLQYPGLIPFAVLGQSVNAEEVLRQVAQRVDRISNPNGRSNLMAASGILAGLKLEDEVIYRIIRRDIMQESTVFRSSQREAQEEAARAISLNLLRSGVSIDIIASSTGLSIEQVLQLQQQLNQTPQS